MREELLSVGIDIGTSTTQLVFSKITIENTATSFSIPRIKIVGKEIIYRSNIYFTPLLSHQKIDGNKIRKIIEDEYKKANINPKEVKTGAVIITGETARKENANDVLKNLSGFAGDFVVAIAGPDLESIIAGKGAGADKISKEEDAVVVSIDIGGGTSNLVVFKNGEPVDTGCLDIGGRLIKIDKETNRISYIYHKIKKLAANIGVPIEEGDIVDLNKLRKIAAEMARILEESVSLREKSKDYEMLITNEDKGKGIKGNYKFDYITFSGGVADYIYNEDYNNPLKYGDIGILLGEEIKKSALVKKIKIGKVVETIGATVVGAGSHTTDISGSTITYTKDMFPVKNLPILKLTKEDESKGFDGISAALNEKLKWFNVDDNSQQIAIALRGMKNPSFDDIKKLSQAIISGITDILEKDYPIYIVVENDIAKVLGQTLYMALNFKKEVVCIDSIKVENGDYIDIGKPVANGKVVPVVIKTLVFNS